MKKGLVDQQMKVVEFKKMKTSKGSASYLTGNRKDRNKSLEASENTLSLSEILNDLNLNDNLMKGAVVKLALNRFLKNRQPVNVSFSKFLRNFHNFNLHALLCACIYMDSAKISSKGDVRTFIYMFFGFCMLSTKYLDDFCVWNSGYISLWGITIRQAHQLEMFALRKLEYNLDLNMEAIEKIVLDAHNNKAFYRSEHE